MRGKTGIVGVTLLLGLLAAAPASAQQGSDPDAVDVFRSVIAHRLQTAGDTPPFDGCFIAALMGELDPLVEALGPLAAGAFQNPESPCPAPSGDRIELVSLGIGATVSRVRLRVVEGGSTHAEEYTLNTPPIAIEGVPRWTVSDVRIIR
jgi:hypothetical protein